jgi:hypothetical protein
VGLAGRDSSPPGAASGGVTRMGCRRPRRTGRCPARPDMGRRAGRAAGSCAAARGGRTARAAARPDMGRRSRAGRASCPTAAAATAATTATRASSSRAAAGRRATCADVGISRARGRSACAGLESPRRALVGRCPCGAVCAAGTGLGRCARGRRAGFAARSVME